MDDLTAERYDPRRRRKARPDEPDPSLPLGAYPQIERRRRILLGTELPGDNDSDVPQDIHRVVHRKPVTPQGK